MKNIYFDTNNVVSEKIIRKDKSHRLRIAAVLGLTLAVSAIAVNNIPKADTSAEECTTSPCNTTFEVNVQESLSVSVSTPDEWASGDTDEFLRNKIDLDVSTNSSNGFSAYMHSKDTTDLTNANPTASEIAADTNGMYTIETLSTSATRGNFTTNKWGFSLSSASYDGNNYGETDAGNSSSTYYPMSTNNIKIMNGTSTGSQDVYFGTKADMTKASGSYLGTVVFAVVTSNVAPTPGDDPANPTDDTPSDSSTVPPTTNGATYDNNNNRTVYTSISRSGSGSSARTTTTTQVTDGDVTSSYAAPQGESKYVSSYTTSTNMNTGSGSELATGLAIASATAATSGMLFFILAKRRDEDEEDEEIQQ